MKNKKSERAEQLCMRKFKSSVKQTRNEELSSNSPVDSGELQIIGSIPGNSSVQKVKYKLQDNKETNITEESTYRVIETLFLHLYW